MPPVNLCRTAKAHIQEANLNLGRYHSHVLSDPDVAITCLFWSALHLVQAHAEHDAAVIKRGAAKPPGNHGERFIYIKENLKGIRVDYDLLEVASQDARYDLVKRSARDVEALHDSLFVPIKTYMGRRGIELSSTNTVKATPPSPLAPDTSGASLRSP